MTLVLSLIAMLYLSWQITLIAVVVISLFVVPVKLIGKKLQRLARQQMQLTAEVGALMNERFNVAGAMLSKLYGRPDQEADLFTSQAGRVRDISIVSSVYARGFFIVVTTLASLINTLVYGLGGNSVISGTIKLGTVVALVTLIARLYGPINQLTSLQANYMTMLVSFDRIFEVVDLKPLIAESPHASPLPADGSGDGTAPDIEFDRVCFRYPTASEVSLPSLESIALPVPEQGKNTWALRDVSFRVPAGKLTALVGPSGAGREAEQILVVDAGQIRERGSHDELLALGGMYAELYRTQFSRQLTHNGDVTASHSDGADTNHGLALRDTATEKG